MALQENELLRAKTHLWNQIFDFVNSASLKCAVELGIPDIVHRHGQPNTLEELADALCINKAKADHLGRLMRVLTRSGLFIDIKITHDKDLDGQAGYALALPSHLLLNDHPFSMAPFLLGAIGTVFTGQWHRLSEWFHNDDPTPYETAYGRTFWDYASQDSEINHGFNQAMASDTLLLVTSIKKYCREVFEELVSIVDVGGGTGMVAKAIADEFPSMKCTVLDLPHVVAGLEGTKNVAYVAGSMFESVPPAQAVFLKHVLHNWNEDDCVKILKNCKEAIPRRENGGKVIIVDVILDTTQNVDDETIQSQIFLDMQMMVYHGGRERALKDWVKLFYGAGFTDYKTTLLGSRSLIQLFP